MNGVCVCFAFYSEQGFESFVMRCPREVTPHLIPIINVALQYIKYDPNYSYGDDEDENDDVDMDGEEYEEVCVSVLFIVRSV